MDPIRYPDAATRKSNSMGWLLSCAIKYGNDDDGAKLVFSGGGVKRSYARASENVGGVEGDILNKFTI